MGPSREEELQHTIAQMPQIRFSEKAQADLSRLYFYLAKRDLLAANRAIDTLKNAFKTLEKHPEIYRFADEDNQLREQVIEFGNSGYVALYRWDETLDHIIVLAIKHQLEKDYGLNNAS